MRSPYADLPSRAFWRTGVANQNPQSIGDLYRPKFTISRSSRVVTAGSCFAQHISRQLRARDYSLLDVEPAPPGLEQACEAEYGYGLFSARYGNIYTSRQLLQIFREAEGAFRPADSIWERDGRFFDAMRPAVEPDGLSSPEHVRDCRAYHLRQISKVIGAADIFVFTLGLTETWTHAPSGTVYPTAPGTIAGSYDPAVHRFQNLTFQDVYSDMSGFLDLAEERNPNIRFLLTVSPVPLTATAAGGHVLAATVYSKSVLRAVAGQLYEERGNVDYFPSYEIVTSTLSRGGFFHDNLRSVTAEGVEAVMNLFFAAQGDSGAQTTGARHPSRTSEPISGVSDNDDDDVICEEVLLDAFSR